ncbi:MAG: 1-acyl-sn-glycerol-3-phosphate acyltransferase [Flavobacteriaceae bacterium]|nr:1-acyl-sn-glycerol-3-phosphate acyltransferase [Flavobacteriaceae bacterium]
MKLVLSYILSSLYYLFFGLVLVIFHGIQWICHKFFGYQAHKKSVDILNLFLLRCLHFLGGRVTFENSYKDELEKNQPHIIVANHQSMYDIPPLIWYFRKLHPKFISKMELGKGIPSISYNLRHGGSILIDRKNPRQSLPEIKKFTQYLNQTNNAAVIFPEGTRSRTGHPKSFSANGLLMLFKNCPNAKIIPVTINNSWKLQKKGSFPLGVGVHIHIKVQEPILVKDFTPKELVEVVENNIIKDIQVIENKK